MQDGPIIFTRASRGAKSFAGSSRALQSGSLLRLTGVCSIQGGERHEPVTFRLLLRQPADIQLLETPPWWTTRHTFMLAGGMMLAIACALAWVALLRRQVRTQTQLIREKLEDEAALEERYLNLYENANDMVYTHDLEGRITSINQTGERLLQRSRDQILSRKIVDLVVPEEKAAAQNWLDQVLKGHRAAHRRMGFHRRLRSTSASNWKSAPASSNKTASSSKSRASPATSPNASASNAKFSKSAIANNAASAMTCTTASASNWPASPT